ncbi:MAG: hypothetical protein ACREIU_10165, partial [Planctomycetota bacterium]
LLHLLLLLLSKNVWVETGIEEAPPRSPTYRVRVLPDSLAIARSKGRGERIEQAPGEAEGARRASLEAPEPLPAPVEEVARSLAPSATPPALVQTPAPSPAGPEDRGEPDQASVPLRDRDPTATERRSGGSAPLLLAESATRVGPSSGGHRERTAASLPPSEAASPAPANASIPLRGERIAAAQPRLGEPGPSNLSLEAPNVAAGEALPARAALGPSGPPTLAMEARSQPGSAGPVASPSRWSSEGDSNPASLSPGPIEIRADQGQLRDSSLAAVRPPAVSAPGERAQAEVSSPALRAPGPVETAGADKKGTALPGLALEARSGTGSVEPERTPDRWLPEGRSSPSFIAPGPIVLGSDPGG